MNNKDLVLVEEGVWEGCVIGMYFENGNEILFIGN